MNDNRKFSHYMLSEIHEHPRTIRDTLAGGLSPETGTVALGSLPLSVPELRSLRWIQIIASGTSRYAGLYGKCVIEELAGIEVGVDYASEFECRKSSFVPPLAIYISQSGETSDTLAALHKAKLAGSRTLAICNVENSSMMRDAHSNLHIKAGPELSVPSTKAFGGQLTCLLLLALSLAQTRHSLRNDEIEHYAHELAALPEKLESTLKLEKRCAEIAEKCLQTPDFIFFGRGPHYPIALDGALKLKEAANIHSEGYPGGELEHGQITLIDQEIVAIVIATCDNEHPESLDRYRRQLSSAKKIKALSGRLVVLATEGNQEVTAVADEVLYLPAAKELLLPLLEIVPLEMLAYFISVGKGLNPDRPRNLNKAVVASEAS
jgi:glucosamine--fructose-6-phosphate aminotransferase (isomerizing)